MGDCKVYVLIFGGFAGELVSQSEFLNVDHNEVADFHPHFTQWANIASLASP